MITEVTVRLYGIPAAISSAVCSFPSVEAAVNVVIKTIQTGVPERIGGDFTPHFSDVLLLSGDEPVREEHVRYILQSD